MAIATVTAATVRQEVRDLAALPPGAPVTTCYLNVDGRRRPRIEDCVTAFNSLSRADQHQAQPNGAGLDGPARDISAMRDAIWTMRRKSTRGLYLAVSGPRSLFTAFELSVPLRDEIILAPRPHLMQLAGTIDRDRRVGVAVMDEVKLRFFVHEFGELVERRALVEVDGEHRDRQKGWNIAGSDSSNRGRSSKWLAAGTHVDRRNIAMEHRHVEACAKAVGGYVRFHNLTHLVMGGPDWERIQLEDALDASSRAMIAGRVGVRVNAPASEVGAAVEHVIAEIVNREQNNLVATVEQAASRQGAVCGLNGVLGALSQGRIRSVVVSEATATMRGTVCPVCEQLSSSATVCPACGAVTLAVDDVAEEIVRRAVVSGTEVHILDSEHPLVDVGGIAGFLRFVAVPA